MLLAQLILALFFALPLQSIAAERPDRANDAGPPPKIPLPPAPPADTKFSIDLKRQMDIPDAQKVDTKDVKLVPISPDKLPSLNAASGPLPAIRLEASYVEPTTLTDVLSIALENNLPIKIAKTEFRSKRYQVLASAGNLLPNVATGYTTSRTWFNGGRADAPGFYNIIYLPVFNGGQDVFRLFKSVHESKASNFACTKATNDVLLDAYEKYQDLLLQYALLQVRVKAVDVSTTQLQDNQDRKDAGEGTMFEVLQSQTRLAQDKQLLLRQQVTFRKAALLLAQTINISPAINVLPQDTLLSECLLLDPRLNVADFLTLAIDRRPEMKQNEQLRLAARRRVQEELASLYPNAKFFLATNTKPKNDSSGGIIIPAGDSLAGGLISTGSNGANISNTFTAGFVLNWLLPGMGVVDIGNGLALREQARKVTLQANETLLRILEEVRASYLEVLTTKEEITVTHSAVTSASEELRIADLRVRYGVGTNLELLSAQKDYFDALSRQAEAIVNYRKSQARLLRDTGTISIASLTTDRRPIRVK